MDCFTTLPEDSVSEILSRTSPVDVSRFAVISKGFKSAAGSDTVWDRFLPSEIVSRSVSPVVYATKKELYFGLCHSPILIDGGKLSFSLEKKSGKKCYMVGARELWICWGGTPTYWKWTSRADSRFSEVAVLRAVCWLDIHGEIQKQMLSSDTTYGAYLVFKLDETCYGLEHTIAVVRGNIGAEDGSEVHLQPAIDEDGRRLQRGRVPVTRGDGWMEIELGSCYYGHGDDGVIEVQLRQTEQLHWKSGLIVEGIEFRPKT